jgi:hypothetical protein
VCERGGTPTAALPPGRKFEVCKQNVFNNHWKLIPPTPNPTPSPPPTGTKQSFNAGRTMLWEYVHHKPLEKLFDEI